MMYQVRQLNCGKRLTCTANVNKWKSQIALLQEPSRGCEKELRKYGNVYTVNNSRSLIFIDKRIDSTMLPSFTDKDITAVMLEKQNIIVCSLYLDIKKAAWPKIIYDLVHHCKQQKIKLIIGADTNAHSSMWGSINTNNRGETIEQAIIRQNLFVHNDGKDYTFIGGVGNSKIDVTLSSHPNLVQGWQVLKEPSFSDHNIIQFEIHGVQELKNEMKRNIKNVQWGQIGSWLENQIAGTRETEWGTNKIEEVTTRLNDLLKKQLDEYAPKKPPAKRFCAWWNDDCSAAKSEARRAETKFRSLPTSTYKIRLIAKRKKYKKTLIKAKRTSWRKFITEVNSASETAKVNKIMRKSGGPTPELGLVMKDGQMTENKQETLEAMLAEHFPGSEPWQPQRDQIETEGNLTPRPKWLSVKRFRAAVKGFKNGKTPGPDEFRAECLKKLQIETIEYILDLFHASVQLNYVPEAWREVKVIFIPKPGKTDYTNKRSFRPISLMSVMFKTLERLILWHIEEENLKQNPIHKLQFGFRKGRSTEHALSKAVNIIEKGINQRQYVLGAFCDIAGAFDNVKMDSIIKMMEKRGINKDIIKWYSHFLKERKVVSTLGQAIAAIKPGKGTPQGGVLSAIISWNLIFDDLLRRFDRSPITMIAFADDGTLLITGPVLEALYDGMQDAIKKATDWGEEHGLKFCPKKTSTVLFTRRKTPPLPKIFMYGEEVPNEKTVKLLGVTLDSKMSWNTHIDNKIKQCKKALMQTLPIMRHTWSPKPKYTRWLYKDVILPILLYGCHLWAHKTENAQIMSKLNRLQRLGLYGITNVRKSTPTAAMEVLYDIAPLHLAIRERTLNTIRRLRTLHAEGDWLPTDSGKKGHLKIWRQELPADLSSTKLEVPEPNFNNNFDIIIDQNLNLDSEVRAFTDGSLIYGQSGAGAVLYLGGVPICTLSERLPECTVFQAELRAIRAAAEAMNGCRGREVSFYVDSQAALKALNAAYITDDEVLRTVEALNKVANENRVTLRWIKAHVGHEGNEAADRAAKEGATSNRWVLDVTESTESIKLQNRNELYSKWKRAWQKRKDCRQSKLFLKEPDKNIWKLIEQSTPEGLSRIMRFVTGHTFMNRHNTIVKYGKAGLETHDSETSCRLCEEEEETPEHLITDCPVLNQARVETLYAWQLDTPPPFSAEVAAFIKLPQLKELEEDQSTAAAD